MSVGKMSQMSVENMRANERANKLKKELEELKGRESKEERERQVMTEDGRRGKQFAQSELGLGEGSLGRAKRVAQVDTGRLQDLSQGLSAEELQATRDQAKGEINRSTQLQNRRLQALQSQQGIRGATAGAQQLGIMQQGEDRKADFERDLFLKDRDTRVQGVNNLLQAQQFNQQQLQEQERFNLAQAAQEKYDLAQAALSFTQMGINQRQAEKATQAQERAAASAGGGCFDGDTRILLYNNQVKKIKDLKLGDILKSGGTVYNLFCGVKGAPVYMYRGVAVSGTHAVKHGGEFTRIENIEGLDRVDKVPYVYNVSTTTHRIIALSSDNEPIEFADFDECGATDVLSGQERLDVLNGKR